MQLTDIIDNIENTDRISIITRDYRQILIYAENLYNLAGVLGAIIADRCFLQEYYNLVLIIDSTGINDEITPQRNVRKVLGASLGVYSLAGIINNCLALPEVVIIDNIINLARCNYELTFELLKTLKGLDIQVVAGFVRDNISQYPFTDEQLHQLEDLFEYKETSMQEPYVY